MVEIGAFDVGGGAVGDGADVSRERLRIALVEPLVAFAQGFGDGAREGFAGFLGDGLREPVCLRILDVQALFFLSVPCSTFLYLRPLSDW